MPVEAYFPNLNPSNFRVTSPASPTYNCIAWAAGQTDAWWWPDRMGVAYWPEGAPREESLDAFLRAFETLGYTRCDSDALEPGFEKVALYARGTVPAHAARQTDDGNWTSKLGELEDIEHTLDGLTGALYGTVVQLLMRPSRTATPHS
jgi:hypothetical protein